MEMMYLGMVIFLFLLAAFDLWVGVSNDAVNFLNSAIGAKAAKFRTIIIVAAIGVFCGAAMSDGMMDIARHGIFRPEQFYFGEIMLILLAVMVTDVVLLDVFNTLGMPTSTTVSMVFELLGATFAFAMLKMISVGSHSVGDYMNTDKALEIVISIFLSVAIAFVFGAIVQWISRLIFTFNYRKGLRWKIGIFGGLAITAIVYFMLFKGLKHISFMTPDVKVFIDANVGWVLLACFVVFSLLMQLLHALRVSVLRIVVLVGTFALATAFAGNDLVNFIGVPLAGFSAYQDFAANGGGADFAFTMNSLNGPASTPIYFLVAAGVIMVFSLATSKKAHNVVKTSVSLASKDEGDEMFGSSRMARSLVRFGNNVGQAVAAHVPERLSRFIDHRFAPAVEPQDDGVAYDLVRAAVNLVIAALLIALGTSLKLPLSTTYVTFMVAMGSSLADRAWSRESAVFRITGVLTVIGGWFITAGVAFTASFFVALAMYYGEIFAVVAIVALGIYALYHSQQRYAKKQAEEKKGDVLFMEMLACKDANEITPMLCRHLNVSTAENVELYASCLSDATDGLFDESLRTLRRTSRTLSSHKRELKNLRRRETICLRRADPVTAVRLSTNFHLLHNSLRQMLYCLLRISEPAREHVDNNFTPIDAKYAERFRTVRERLLQVMNETAARLRVGNLSENEALRVECTNIRKELSVLRKEVLVQAQTSETNLTPATLFLHVVQETEQLCIEVRHILKSTYRFTELS